MDQQVLMPFRENTRPHTHSLDTQAWSAGRRLTFKADRVGLVEGFFIRLTGTLTLSNTGTATATYPFALINNLSVLLNLGNTTLYDVPGYDAAFLPAMFKGGFHSALAGIGSTTPHSSIYATALANGANTITLTYWVPLTSNDGENRTIGLINAQAEQVTLSLYVDCGQGADITNNFTSFTGNVEVITKYYELPDPQQVEYPPLMLLQTLSEQIPFANTGEILYPVPHLGILLQVYERIMINAVMSDTFTGFRLQIDKTNRLAEETPWLRRLNNQKTTKVVLPTGVYLWDFASAYGMPNSGPLDDAIDTMKVSTLDLITQITSGTTLGSGTNILYFTRRVLTAVTY